MRLENAATKRISARALIPRRRRGRSSHATASRNNRRNLAGDRSSINQRIMLAEAYAPRDNRRDDRVRSSSESRSRIRRSATCLARLVRLPRAQKEEGNRVPSIRTRKNSHVDSLPESRRVVVEIGHTNGEIGRRLVNPVAGDHLKSILGTRFGVQTLPQDNLAAVSVDAEGTRTRHVAKSIRQRRRTIDVVRRDGRQHGSHGST